MSVQSQVGDYAHPELFTPERLILHGEALNRNEGFDDGRKSAEIDIYGIYNNEGFRREAALQVARSKSNGTPAGIAMADLDGLKAVNDELGHPEGDKLIARAKSVIRDMAADDELPSFIAGRVGGDEFAMLVEGDEEQTQLIANEFGRRYQEVVDSPENTELQERGVSLSVGYANLSEKIDTFSKLMRSSDEDMYKNKVAKIGELSRRDKMCLLAARYFIKMSSSKKRRLRDAPKYWRMLNVLD